MAVSDVASCAAIASQPDLDLDTRASDVFAVRRRQFYAAIGGRCGGNQTSVVMAYARLRNTFMQRLAGRFPFVDSTQLARAYDADPVAVRDFLKEYDAFTAAADVSMRSSPGLAQQARAAIAFLDQVADVRPFLAPVLEAEKGLPEYSVWVRSGDNEWGTRWRWGDSLHISTLVDSLGNERALYVRGGWAALRAWATNPDSTTTIKFFHPRTAAELVPPKEFPVVAPEIVLPGRR
jgi:hypothetical protein